MMRKWVLILTPMIMSCAVVGTAYAQGGCWVTKRNMSEERCLMPAVALNDTIYVIGGSMDAYSSTSTVEAYDAAADNWTRKANLPQRLCGQSAGMVNGKIYVIGGSSTIYGTGYVVDSVYEYSPASNSWTRKSNIPTPLMCAASAVVNGRIYVFGGCPFGLGSAYKSVYEYDPSTDTWTKKMDMPTERFLASATAVDGKIYVFGGVQTLAGTSLSTLEVYDPLADTWDVRQPMPIRRSTHASCDVGGNIYIFSGGLGMGSIYDDVLEYNPMPVAWATKTPIPTPRVAPAACSVGGKIYVIGGMDNSNTRLLTVEEYDPALDITSIAESHDARSPVKYSLGQNYPNPCNPTTTIRYQLPQSGVVSLSIFNTLGQIVSVLVDAHKEAGYYEVQWNANVPSGVYFCRMQARSFVETKKMIVVK